MASNIKKQVIRTFDQSIKNLNNFLGPLVISRSEVVIYTAIIGGIDNLLPPLVINNRARYICFSDRPIANPGVWKIINAELPYTHSRMNARWYKINSNRFFPSADYSIWLDGTFQMKIDPVQAIHRWLSNEDIAFIIHPKRDCIYDEINACKDTKKDDPEVLNSVAKIYRAAGYPEHNGLIASGVIFRHHTKTVCQLNDAWWQEISKYSIRDQVSFNYVAYNLGIGYGIIPGDYWKNEYFPYTNHVKDIPQL
ncbi:MAG: DUF616 domain-containing protein [Deltaproteobacteria bacterium]|nr:DUF616 domain-containing protein [Deltaproteobacteria bacterium]